MRLRHQRAHPAPTEEPPDNSPAEGRVRTRRELRRSSATHHIGLPCRKSATLGVGATWDHHPKGAGTQRRPFDVGYVLRFVTHWRSIPCCMHPPAMCGILCPYNRSRDLASIRR